MSTRIHSEVCNLVFNNGDGCGALRGELADLQNPGDWHDTGVGATSAGGRSGD